MQLGVQKYVQCHTGQGSNTYHPWVNLKANTFQIEFTGQHLPRIAPEKLHCVHQSSFRCMCESAGKKTS